MKRLILLAIVPLACASNATAGPAPAAPAAPASCKPTGTPVFEIDHRIEPDAKLPTSATKVFRSGAWTHDETDADGKPLPAKTGCYAKADVAQLEASLQGVPWTVIKARMHCMAISATFTVYQVAGKPVFTQRLCSGESLDAKSKIRQDGQPVFGKVRERGAYLLERRKETVVPLKHEGINKVEFVAQDMAGNETRADRTATVDSY